MQSGKVYRNNILAGFISRTGENEYRFKYDEKYLESDNTKAISLSLPLQKEEYVSKHLFSFFFNMISEGALKDIQCRELRIDKDDHFSRLLKTTENNTIGSITIEEIKDDECQLAWDV